MGLLIGNTAGTDMNLAPDKINAYKKFANKIWNITRFILMNVDDVGLSEKQSEQKDDTKLLDELKTLSKEVTKDIENYHLYIAGEKMYHYVWHRFADEVLEESKPILQGDDAERKKERVRTLYDMLLLQLKLLHPFMPFLTEEIWQSLPEKETDLIMVAKWPKFD
jgi:valyl-tRNA synthetase